MTGLRTTIGIAQPDIAQPDIVTASHQGMAHFAGTGPRGKTCGACEHWVDSPMKRIKVCAKYRDLTHSWSKCSLPKDAMACRYFGAVKETAL